MLTLLANSVERNAFQKCSKRARVMMYHNPKIGSEKTGGTNFFLPTLHLLQDAFSSLKHQQRYYAMPHRPPLDV